MSYFTRENTSQRGIQNKHMRNQHAPLNYYQIPEDPKERQKREEKMAKEFKNSRRPRTKAKAALGALLTFSLASAAGGYKLASDQQADTPTYEQGYRAAKANVAAMGLLQGDPQILLGVNSEGVTAPKFNTVSLKCYVPKTKNAAQICLNLTFGQGIQMAPTSSSDATLEVTLFGRNDTGISMPAAEAFHTIKENDCKKLLETINTDVTTALTDARDDSVQNQRYVTATHYLDGGAAIQNGPFNPLKECK